MRGQVCLPCTRRKLGGKLLIYWLVAKTPPSKSQPEALRTFCDTITVARSMTAVLKLGHRISADVSVDVDADGAAPGCVVLLHLSSQYVLPRALCLDQLNCWRTRTSRSSRGRDVPGVSEQSEVAQGMRPSQVDIPRRLMSCTVQITHLAVLGMVTRDRRT